jgi:hypothetical protein
VDLKHLGEYFLELLLAITTTTTTTTLLLTQHKTIPDQIECVQREAAEILRRIRVLPTH